MKVKMLLIFLVAIFLIFSCQKKNSTEPENENIHPQQDIPWPSLADSPWPMFHHDPQGTGRSLYPGPTKGKISKVVTIAQGGSIFSSTTIGPQGEIYLSVGNVWSDSLRTTDAYLFKFDKSGSVSWKINLGGYEIYNSALIDKDGIIYLGSTDHCFYAIKPDGTIKWKFCTESEITGDLRGANIGLDGTLYFSTVTDFYALNNDGTLKWSLPGFGNARALISPDGNTLYVYSVSLDSLIALDCDGKIRWTYHHIGKSHPCNLLVDSNGRIYFSADDSTYSALDENGELIWEFSISKYKNWINDCIDCNSAPTIDKMGNFYFLTINDLYSLNYSGKLRWIIRYAGDSGIHPICDAEGNIYLLSGWNSPTLRSISNSGSVNWELPLSSQLDYAGSCPSIAPDGKLYLIASSHGYSKLYIVE